MICLSQDQLWSEPPAKRNWIVPVSVCRREARPFIHAADLWLKNRTHRDLKISPPDSWEGRIPSDIKPLGRPLQQDPSLGCTGPPRRQNFAHHGHMYGTEHTCTLWYFCTHLCTNVQSHGCEAQDTHTHFVSDTSHTGVKAPQPRRVLRALDSPAAVTAVKRRH